MPRYIVVPFKTSFFSGTLNPRKLEDTLNEYALKDWEFVRSIHETQRMMFFFRREAHFMIFKKSV